MRAIEFKVPGLCPLFFKKTVWLLPLLLPLGAGAQVSNLRTRILDARLPVQILDSLSILPPLSLSDSATGAPIAETLYRLEHRLLRLDTAALQQRHPGCSHLRASYRVLPFDLGAATARIDTALIRKALGEEAIEFDYTPYEAPSRPWETGGLQTNGTYTRGLSFGNNQNLVFNSNLNLQLDGKLGNDLELRAALSDNSIPLQPDGTTRQLQEFDRIYLQLKRRSTILTAGDYDLYRPNGYFSQYFKRLQGAMVEHRALIPHPALFSRKTDDKALPPRDTVSARGAAAISRGKFARQLIAGVEGNQGPYRLQGAEGERFIIVLAGTEKVFIDGQIMRRGLDDDYTIDYNLGEITFTQRRLVTKDSRIIVEFEYTVQTYLRSTLAANTEWRSNSARAWLNLYAEQDSRNAGGPQPLSAAERSRLAEVGDNLREAYASGIDTLSEGYDPTRVLYQYIDTLVCGTPLRILAYSNNPDSALYAARFTEVPQGQGNYIQVASAANGRVYRWVAPDPLSCQPQGNFEPVVRLIAPESRQLYTAGAQWQNARSFVLAEAALSNRDLNLFSPLGNADNTGWAGYLSLRRQLLSAPDGWQAYADARYEHTAKTFLPLNPYRPAEFVRDWNTELATPAAEHLARGGISVQHGSTGQARYEFGTFVRTGLYEAYRHVAQLNARHRGFDLLAEINVLTTESEAENSRFSRPKFDLSKTFFRKKQPLFKVGLYGERERNTRRAPAADTLYRTSFWYDLARLYFQTPQENAAWSVGGNLFQRNDYFPEKNNFTHITTANEANLNGRWSSRKGQTPQQLVWNGTWRTLRILDPERTTLEPQNTWLGRVDYNISAWKNLLALTTGYELGSGQSPRVEFSYIPVNPGEGQYAWIDRNQDSILQVDEMEIAVFQDQASYVRIAVTTPDYIRTNNVLFNQNLRLEPRNLIGNTRIQWKKGLSRLATQSTLQINRKTFAAAGGIDPWNPFQLNVPDSALVTLGLALRNVLFVNRAHPVWDLSLTQNDNRNRLALTTGFESRRNAEWILHGRVSLGKHWNAQADLSAGAKSNDNEAFASRDFNIRVRRAGPTLSWLPLAGLRLDASMFRQNSRNTLPSAENAVQDSWNLEMAWNPRSKPNAQGYSPATALRLKGSFNSIRYEGAPNTAVSYAMLDALQDGRNFLWSLQLDRQLSRYMQLSIQYEGRKTGDLRMVHIGRAQVRALF